MQTIDLKLNLQHYCGLHQAAFVFGVPIALPAVGHPWRFVFLLNATISILVFEEEVVEEEVLDEESI